MSRQAQLLVLWAVCSVIAAFVALQFSESAYEEKTDTWVPVGNDSFYHARRIIDAASSPEGLYEFDNKIHVPEGSWITWPWAYDWAMAQGLKAWTKFNPDTQPMAFLAQVPVYWLFVNAAILLGICVLLELSVPWTGLVMVGFALSPLTMLLHGIGIIDHHFIEYSFVLMTVYTGLLYLKHQDSLYAAILLGTTLGIAPAFHTGLFILQAPVLLTIGIMWLRGFTPPDRTLLALASSLILATLIALLPSAAFRDGQFQFSVLSWFHLYIAAVSTLFITSMARFSVSTRSLLSLGALGVVLIVPVWNDTIGGAAFLSGEILFLDKIMEMASPFRMALQTNGAVEVLAYYSLFGILAPLLLLIYCWQAWTARTGVKLYFAIMTVFGLALLFTQFRLHYFGSFALVLGWAAIVDKHPAINKRLSQLLIAAAVLLLAGSFYNGYVQKIKVRYPLGLDPAYEDLFGLIDVATGLCAANPGVIFADNNFGHYLRYHTECSVIANNFLMTPLHEEKIRQMQNLMNMTPEEFLEKAPKDIRYIFARLVKFYGKRDGEFALTSTDYLQKNNSKLFFELNSRDDLPARYRVVQELPLDEKRGLVRARAIEILPAE